MKANEAPEKIWVHELSAKELNVPLKEYHIEYTRTDAFIEKACEWLQKHMNDYIVHGRDIDFLYDDFRKAMEKEDEQ